MLRPPTPASMRNGRPIERRSPELFKKKLYLANQKRYGPGKARFGAFPRARRTRQHRREPGTAPSRVHEGSTVMEGEGAASPKLTSAVPSALLDPLRPPGSHHQPLSQPLARSPSSGWEMDMRAFTPAQGYNFPR
jgi:hypothetical protein